MKPKQSVSNRSGSSANRQRQAKSRRLRSLRIPLPHSPALRFTVGLLAALAPFAADRAAAATRTWIGGNVDWVDNGSTANWTPADEPDSDDDAIFNTANTINLGSVNTVLSLALSTGISLNTNDFNLVSNGLLQLTGAGTDLTIGGSSSTVWADGVALTTSSRIYLEGGVLAVPVGIIDLNSGCTLSGQGVVALNANVAVATGLLVNDGTLSASASGILIGMPAAGSLVINGGYANARLDLDGTSGLGIVNVGRNQLLDINVPLFDSFGGVLNLSHASTIALSAAWSMDAGTLNADNGAVAAPLAVAANTSYISGATFTQSGGTITVVDTDGTLQFNAPFTQSGGDLVNNGKVIFNSNATIGAGANFTMPTDNSSLTVSSGATVTVNQANFNADGNGTAANAITVNGGSRLDLNLGTGADESLTGPVILNGGILNVTTLSNTWSMNGALAIGAATGTSQVLGEALTFSSVDINVGAGSTLNVSASNTWAPTTTLAVGSGALLSLQGSTIFNGPGTLSGAGILRVNSSSTVSASTTVAVNTFDWDGTGIGSLHNINDGVNFTITSPVFDDDGDMDDPLTLDGSSATLTVSGPASWEMKGTLTTNPANVGTAFLNGTSDLVLTSASGIFNATGNTTANASITFGPASVTTVGAGATLDLNAVPAFSGGEIKGAGRLRVGGSPVVTANTAISVGTLDWDRNVFGHTHTINEGVSLTITSPVIEGGGMSDSLTLRGNGTTLTVSGPASWEIRGTLTTNTLATGVATVGGTSDLVLTSATGIFNARGDTSVTAPITLGASSATTVAAGALLSFNATSTIFAGGSVAGAGTLRVNGTSTATANTTIAVNTFDWDGTGIGSLHSITDGTVLTINSAAFDDDGDMDDPISLGGSGATLTVNGPVSWQLRGTLTSNPTDTGVATLGGSSRLELFSAFNASGDTTVSAPISFGAASTTTVAAPAVLSVTGTAIHDGGTITGAGYYNPPVSNTVVSSSVISTTKFNFDNGNWALNAGGHLTVAVSDYDPDVAAGSKAFDASLTITDASLKVTSAEPTFIMDGVMNCHSTITHAAWGAGSDPLDIGNDSGSLDAALNILGTGHTQIATAIDFKSDADVFIDAGAILQCLGAVSFDSVNAANNAEFTGGGLLQTNREVNFNEATTINMTGGTIDLDGADAIGDTIYVKAPVIITVATMDSFGNSNASGTNILDVNHSTATGSLTVNLDSPTAEWTLNSPGYLLLTNDPAAAAVTLLAGSAVNLNGLVNVTGDVRTDARVDIAGSANIQTAGKPFRLSGGNLTDTNTLVGGVINGPGLLGADTNSSLIGHGTINANVDFDGNADLLADNGTLTVNSSILDARFVGTNDTDGILDVVNAWNSNTVAGVSLKGGELKGGTLTNDGTGGITGSGLISSRIINNTVITANTSAAPLILQATADNNDWDGNLTPETGRLQANAGTLELRSSSGFAFNSIVTATNGGTVFANGFELSMMSTSALNLTTGTFKQSNGITTNLSGTITVGAGTSQLLGATTGGFRFISTSATTLTGNLFLDCPTTTIQTGATFGGAGTLANQPGRRLVPENNANLNVLVDNVGTLAPGGTGIARNDFRDFIQRAGGVLEINLNGTTLGTFDRVQVNGSAQLAGTLQLTLGGGYVPVLNDTITILSTTGAVAGLFSPLVQPAGMPAGLAFQVNYLPNSVQLKVGGAFDSWINTFGIANPADRTKAANPDGDSLNNLGEFATDGNPTSGLSSGKIVGKIAPVGGINALTLTLPVRNGTVLDPADPAGGELGLKQTADGLFYKIQASDNLASTPLTVTEVTGPDATAIQLGLPALNSGWTYRTFRSPGPVAGDPVEFMRAVISD